MMTDQEIVRGLLERDNRVTEEFFYVRCRPLLSAVMRLVFRQPVEYNEMVSELYRYLMADDGAKLRQFQFRSTIYQWMKVVATRFFIRYRNSMIESPVAEPLYEQPDDGRIFDTASQVADRIDLDHLLSIMPNQRYADAIRHLVIDDMEPERYAAMIGVSVDNLYNIKKRAMTAFMQLASKYYSYGR